jgi:hypothetical protein
MNVRASSLPSPSLKNNPLLLSPFLHEPSNPLLPLNPHTSLKLDLPNLSLLRYHPLPLLQNLAPNKLVPVEAVLLQLRAPEVVRGDVVLRVEGGGGFYYVGDVGEGVGGEAGEDDEGGSEGGVG